MLEKIKYCKYYDIIMDFKYDDILTNMLKDEYYNMINESKETDKDIKKMQKFDKYLYYYVTDKDFFRYLQSDYKNKELEETFIDDLKEYLYDKYELFQDFTIGTIKSGKWF